MSILIEMQKTPLTPKKQSDFEIKCVEMEVHYRIVGIYLFKLINKTATHEEIESLVMQWNKANKLYHEILFEYTAH